MTIAQKLEARGEARGVEKVAERLLAEGIEIPIIARVTKLPTAKIRELQGNLVNSY